MKENSFDWFQKAQNMIPGGVNSPVRSFKHVGMSPLYFTKGEGASLIDVNGKRYTDFCLSFGPHLLGHSHPSVVKALVDQAKLATSFGACHPQEVRLAELILKSYPFLGKVRLVNSGTEAVMTAVRLARGYTGKDKIVKFEGCYHGHSDAFLVKAGSGVAALSEAASKGVPESAVADTLVAQFGNLSSLEEVLKANSGKVAAIICEAIPANYGLWIPDRNYIVRLTELAKAHGALVIFDEVITGFRLGISGASGFFDVKPDIVTLGKIIGGGLPLAAVAARTEIMDKLAPVGDVYQAGTLSGNPLATAAGIAVLSEVHANAPYSPLAEETQWFTERLKELLVDAGWGPVSISRVASLFWISFGGDARSFPPQMDEKCLKTYASFFKEALDAGVYFAPSPYEVSFLSTAHTREVLQEVLEKLCAKFGGDTNRF